MNVPEHNLLLTRDEEAMTSVNWIIEISPENWNRIRDPRVSLFAQKMRKGEDYIDESVIRLEV